MDLRKQWPILDELCRCAERFPGLEVWAFGSMLRSDRPHDLDILIVYNDRTDVVALREMGFWEVTVPTVDIIAMTPDEEHHYQFINATGALRVHPPF
jgi:predicted nucleotidyltransferase